MIRQTLLAGALAFATAGFAGTAGAAPANPTPAVSSGISVQQVGFKSFGHRRGFRRGFGSKRFSRSFGFKRSRGFRSGVRSKIIIGDGFHGKGFIAKNVPSKKIIGKNVIIIK
ncbi:MAG: hypothetical protein AAF317_21345 [Pseudomonadota bacterium]